MIERVKTILKKTALAMLIVFIDLPCSVGLLIFCKLTAWIEGEKAGGKDHA